MQLIKTKSFELAVNTKGNNTAAKLAISIPGRLDSKDYASFTSHLEYLANKGFYAVAFDPPGTWDSPGSIDLYTTTNYIKAVNELIEHYGNKQTILVGHSRGGAVAVLASSNPSVEAIILVMAAYDDPTPPDVEDVKKGFKVSFRDLPPGDKKTKEQKRFDLPINYWQDGKKYNVKEVLSSCTKPKLLFLGTEDEFYTTGEIEEIFNSIPEPKTLHVLNSDHDYRYYPGIIEEVNKVMGDFLNKYV